MSAEQQFDVLMAEWQSDIAHNERIVKTFGKFVILAEAIISLAIISIL